MLDTYNFKTQADSIAQLTYYTVVREITLPSL